MKKILFILLFIFILCSMSIPVSAGEIKSIYVIKNTSIPNVLNEIKQQLSTIAIKEIDNIVYSKENNFYLKAYKNSENVEIFVYSKNDDLLSVLLDKISIKVYKIYDKESFNRYNDDFISFAATNSFNNIKSKKQNKKEYQSYNPYSGKLRNKVLEVDVITQNNIRIERKKLKPKAKVKHYAYGYEYTITNNTGKDIIIKNVASSDFIGLTQIAAYTIIPRGMDFVPVYGIIYGVQSDLEKNKFTRPHPTNEKIKKDGTMRILALSKKQDNPIADFTFVIDEKEILIKF